MRPRLEPRSLAGYPRPPALEERAGALEGILSSARYCPGRVVGVPEGRLIGGLRPGSRRPQTAWPPPARRLTEDALHDRGLTLRQLQDAGVSHAAVMKVLRTSE